MLDSVTILGKAVEYLLAGAIGWLVASFSFQRRIDEFEKRNVMPLSERLSKFEGAALSYVPREELKAEIVLLRADFKDMVVELKSLIREIRSEKVSK